MQCHEIDYVVRGQGTQFIEVELDPGETVIAEAGAMLYMEEDIVFEAKMGDGSSADQGFFNRLVNAGKRVIAGESLFLTHFSNRGRQKRTLALAPAFPGSIIPVNMAEVGGAILCQKDAFLAAALGTQVDVAFTRRLGSGFFGGEGFILQKVKGDGMAFIHAGGTLIKKTLNDETLRLWIPAVWWPLPRELITTYSCLVA